ARYEQRSLFRQTRPWSHLDDSADGARPGSRPNLTEPFAQVSAQLGAFRLDELELTPDGLREDQDLQRQREHRRREVEQFRPDRGAQAGGLGGRVSQRHRPPPRAAADKPRRKRELAQRPPTALRSS